MAAIGGNKNISLYDSSGNPIESEPDANGDYHLSVSTNQSNGVPLEYSKQSANSEDYLIAKGGLNKLRLRPRVLNEHVESSKELQATVTATNIVGQIFKCSQNNINGIHIAGESAESVVFDTFDTYADDAALQAAWVATDDLATIETTIVEEGTQSMKLPMDTVTGEWVRTVASTNYTSYTGHIHVYQDKEYNRCKLRFFVGDGTNTVSLPLLAIQKDLWYKLDINIDAMTEDIAGQVTDLTAITKVGYRVEDKAGGKFAYIDHMVAIAPPGSINIKLWDMGTTLPTISNSIDDGTQYEKLGDLGITGVQVSEIEVELLGGIRIYPVKEFTAGVSIDITGNELLNIGNYYAITVNYVDTEFSLYGKDDCGGVTCYNNGFAFEAADEATNITKVGTYNNLTFAVFSVQDVYLVNMRLYADAAPADNSNFNIYTKDTNYKRTNTIIASATGRQTFQGADLSLCPPFLVKGGMLKTEYNDDFTDSVSKITMGMRYKYIPPTVNG